MGQGMWVALAAWALAAGPRKAVVASQSQDDRHVDSYWPMEGSMTVFGFGRSGLEKRLTAVPAQFTVGFCEAVDPKLIAATVGVAWRPVAATVRAAN